MNLWLWLKRLLGIRPKQASGRPRPGAVVGRWLPSMTATEVLQRVGELQKACAQWPEMWAALNPDGAAKVQRLLVELRGPHMFAPQAGLNVVEDGCRRALAHEPSADRLAALKAALKSGDPFVRPD
jgi:hypothetical protein